MLSRSLFRSLAGLVLASAVVVAGAAARAETPVGSNVDARVILAFAVDAGDVQPWLADGWTPVAFPEGPLEGANLMVVLIDRALDRDAEGKPKSPSQSRAVALAGLGKQVDGPAVNLFVYRIYSTPEGYDPYGNARHADIARSTATTGPANAGRARSESWSIRPDGGGTLDIELEFTSGTPNWGSAEARPHSAVTPEFSRIYRYDQLVDLVMSAPLGKPLTGTFAFTQDVPELAAVFDGTETLVTVMDVPVYTREVSLP